LPVDPAALRPAARKLLLRCFQGHPRDATAAFRHEIEEQLLAIVRGPGREYARMLLTLDLRVERRPITATCLVSLLPQAVDGERALQALAQSMSAGALESLVEDLGPHRGVVVVRDERRAAVDPGPQATRLARRYAAWMQGGDDSGEGRAEAGRGGA